MTAPQSAGDILALAKERAPFLADTLHDIKQLNACLGDRALYRYQADIQSGAGLTMRSPYTGEAASVVALWMQGGAGVIYCFDAGGRFAVSAAELRFGYPMTCLTLGELQLPTYGNAVDGFSKRMQDNGFFDETPDVAFDPAAGPRIVMGSANFAHCMWNEYPGLRHLTFGAVPPRVSLLFDPLGALEARFAKLGLGVDFFDTPHAARGWQPGPTSFVGALYCDAEAKADLFEDCALSDLPEPVSGRIRVYFTIRNRGRTVEDQVGFLAALARQILQEYPKADLVFDGFSVPEDMERRIYDGLRAAFDTRAQEGREIVQQITERLPERARDRVIDLTGASLLEALKVIATCHYYVAHTGTSQHKIAWFFPRPGCIHSNAPSLTPGSLKWLVTQVHNSLVPFSPDPALVEDLDEIDLPNQVNRNKNYRIKDHAAYSAAILENMRSVLPETESKSGFNPRGVLRRLRARLRYRA